MKIEELHNININEIRDISFKYLFNDKISEYNGKFYIYDLVEGSLISANENIIIFKVENRQYQEKYEVKLIYKNSNFYIVSDFLDEDTIEYKLTCYHNPDNILFYKNFGNGEMYLNIELL